MLRLFICAHPEHRYLQKRNGDSKLENAPSAWFFVGGTGGERGPLQLLGDAL